MLTTPVKRSEERGARDSEQEESQPEADEPRGEDLRSLEKRVKRLAERLGWPGWANSSTAWTVARFAELTPEERDRAEERGAAYLALCGRKALSMGVYFKERKFDEIPEAALKAVEPDQRVEAAPFGKLWGALRLMALLRPHGPLPRASSFLESLMAEDSERGERERLAHRSRHGWPIVNDMHRRAENRRGVLVPPDKAWLEAVATGFEQVRVGSDRWHEWKDEHERRGWPWVPDPGRQEWVYFPAGGPAGLKTFETAILVEGSGDDGGQREAAE